MRLARCEANPTPKTFRSESVVFSGEDKENLKMLNRFDQGLAEMFFGQMPILIEGDTEYAAFELIMNKYPDQFPICRKPILVRAHGKHTLVLIMQILNEFYIPFAILHDADSPLRKDGKPNGSWSSNIKIYETIEKIREKGVKIIHRISIPEFEYVHLPLKYSADGKIIETNPKDKPWKIIKNIMENEKVSNSILSLLKELTNTNSVESPYPENFENNLTNDVKLWATKNCPSDIKFNLT